jgi:hypothetical protein
MSEEFDAADYSFVVKRRGTPEKPWRWEIYCAGKSAPLKRSPVFFESMAEAAKDGKNALGQFLAKRAAEIATPRVCFGQLEGLQSIKRPL